jgi:hypothetical protein
LAIVEACLLEQQLTVPLLPDVGVGTMPNLIFTDTSTQKKLLLWIPKNGDMDLRIAIQVKRAGAGERKLILEIPQSVFNLLCPMSQWYKSATC